jgi:hypothetical protein
VARVSARFSKSLARRRLRTSQEKVRSTPAARQGDKALRVVAQLGTSQPEAISLWWPWGRTAPLVDGGPPRPPKPRKATLDPTIITATKPQDIVREVMAKTGINRTTEQRLTRGMRASMGFQRENKARRMLREGRTKAEVARAVQLSPSRISAMFKGKSQTRQPSPDAK